MLIAAGADVNAYCQYKTTALMQATFAKDNYQCLNELIRAGAGVNAGDEDGVLHFFMQLGMAMENVLRP